MKLITVERSKIVFPRYRIRFRKRDKEVEELSRSIQAAGLLCPLHVQKTKGETYSLVAGELRLAALDLLGRTQAPCLELDETERRNDLIMGLVENVDRFPLDPLERAKAFAETIRRYECTHQQLADCLGKDRSYVSHQLRLLDKIHPTVLDYLCQGKITSGHAFVLMRLKDLEAQLPVAREIVKEKLTIAETALLVDQARPEGELTEREKELNAIERKFMKLKKDWRSRIKITQGRKYEELRVRFSGEEELKDLIKRIADAL